MFTNLSRSVGLGVAEVRSPSTGIIGSVDNTVASEQPRRAVRAR